MLWSVLCTFLLALCAPWIARVRSASGWLFGLLPAGLALYFLHKAADIAAGATLIEAFPWVPGLGITLSFYLDGLSLLFALLITTVGALVLVYAGRYLAGDPQLGRFYLYLTGFMGAMLGLVLAGNLITLFVFWELTSVASYFLIGFRHREEASRSASLQALLVTGGGGLALLAAFLLAGLAAGTLEIPLLLERGDTLRAHGAYGPIVLLVALGAFTKSAQFPFHFWLPSAMQAPTPVSAYLHSVTMVKAGVYLLARLTPALGGTPHWNGVLLGIGALTMLLGAVMAVGQSDLKRLLAYSTVNALGTLVFLLGIGTEEAVRAAVVFLLAHALYKGTLFLSAGIVEHETGTRDLRRLRGLAWGMPFVSGAVTLAALSMAGLPPLAGFLGKEGFYRAALGAPTAAAVLIGLAVLASIFLVVAAARMTLIPFFAPPGSEGSSSRHGHGVPVALGLGPVLLAAAGLLVGVFPGLVARLLLTPAAGAVFGRETAVSLALWHGLDAPLVLSVLTLAGGLVLYAMRGLIDRWAEGMRPWSRWGPESWYRGGLALLTGAARGQTRLLQHGYLSGYILALFLTAVALACVSLLRDGGYALALPLEGLYFFELVVALLILASAVVAIRSDSRLGAIVAMGGIGYGIALIFIEFGAPDLAMTQFIIETIVVILFVLVVYRLPRYVDFSPRRARLRDALVAATGGILMSLLVLAALGSGTGSRLSGFFAEETYPSGRGRNIVNVILVDFRALDTLGEITVLGLAGAGVAALIRVRVGQRARGRGP